MHVKNNPATKAASYIFEWTQVCHFRCWDSHSAAGCKSCPDDFDEWQGPHGISHVTALEMRDLAENKRPVSIYW